MKPLLESSVLGAVVKVSGFQGVHVLPGPFSSRAEHRSQGCLPLSSPALPSIQKDRCVQGGRVKPKYITVLAQRFPSLSVHQHNCIKT